MKYLRNQHRIKRRPEEKFNAKQKSIKVWRLLKSNILKVPKNLRFVFIFVFIFATIYMIYIITSTDFSEEDESHELMLGDKYIASFSAFTLFKKL
jgi:hypothetical protein